MKRTICFIAAMGFAMPCYAAYHADTTVTMTIVDADQVVIVDEDGKCRLASGAEDASLDCFKTESE